MPRRRVRKNRKDDDRVVTLRRVVVNKKAEEEIDPNSNVVADRRSAHYPADDVVRPHNEHIVDEVYEAAKDLVVELKDGENVLDELADLSAKVMQLVAAYPSLNGSEKKMIVLQVVQRLVSELKLDDNVSAVTKTVINQVLPRVIDLIIAAADGKLDLGRKWRTVKKGWNAAMGLCCCCAGGRRACTC